MNSTNINVTARKSQSRLPVTKLIELDRQIAASNYGPDHPWRLALAGILAIEYKATRQTDGEEGGDPIRQQAHEIESRIGGIAILLEAIFDKLDAMNCDMPEDRRLNQAIHTFANSAMESAQAIRAANEQILSLTGGVQ